MKHVYTNNELPHVWANNRHEVRSGRTGNGNFYFEGDTIYSYGSHFPIARFVEVAGETVVLITRRSYSMTTSQHVSRVRQAVSHLPTVSCHSPSGSPREEMEAALKLAGEAAIKAPRARSDWRKAQLLETVEEMFAAARFHAKRGGIKLPADLDKAVAGQAKRAKAEQARIAQAHAEQRKAQEAAKVQAETLWEQAKPHWRRDETIPAEIEAAARALGYYSFRVGTVAMRLRGDEIETSQGARFPVEHGIRAFRILKGIWERGGTWERKAGGVGPRLGHYTVDRVTPDSVVAGCHTVQRSEVELMAALLSVTNIEPAPVATAVA
jgi:hypothetical protein